ncbi:MAG: hypothetical protein M1821_006929 [Bathelium mastoideum]|nr:MAG: hypothetical protein M1821_006929 [Bathelium mastoideum]KAI9692282.1 MAG: hypothetical protein M1822_006513 [Bathelium mastoideum]
MAAAPLTPQEDTNELSHSAKLRYDEAFETEVAEVVNNPPPADGIPVDGEKETSMTDAWSQELPDIAHDELPLPLQDPRRKFRSPVAGVRLTHPGGLLEGGPALDEDVAEAQKFIDQFQVKSSEELEQKVSQQLQVAMDELRSRASARQAAVENNEKVDRELQQHVAQREVEVRIEQRAKERKGTGR